jgi:hypothetical protein
VTNLLGSLCRVRTLRAIAVALPGLRTLVKDNVGALAAAAGLEFGACQGAAARGPVLSHLPETHDGRGLVFLQVWRMAEDS